MAGWPKKLTFSQPLTIDHNKKKLPHHNQEHQEHHNEALCAPPLFGTTLALCVFALFAPAPALFGTITAMDMEYMTYLIICCIDPFDDLFGCSNGHGVHDLFKRARPGQPARSEQQPSRAPPVEAHG